MPWTFGPKSHLAMLHNVAATGITSAIQVVCQEIQNWYVLLER